MIKNDFLSINLEIIEDVKFITLRRYLLVINSNSMEDFKSKIADISLHKVQSESKKLKKDNHIMKSSNSSKITTFFRKIKK